MHLLAASPPSELPLMLRDAFASDAAAVKHRFCNSFRGLCPIDIEFSTFSFRNLARFRRSV
jgi:hypothetical protein